MCDVIGQSVTPCTRGTMDALNLVTYCLLCGCEGMEGVAVRV